MYLLWPQGGSAGVKLSDSDILSEALTKKRLISECVCEVIYDYEADKYNEIVTAVL